MHFQQERHHRLFDLASERATTIQEVAFDELLSQRGATLLYLSGTQIHERRSHDRAEIDAMMRVELTILDDLERCGEHCRNICRCDDHAILAMDRKDAADQ